jgi:hypothetical protein
MSAPRSLSGEERTSMRFTSTIVSSLRDKSGFRDAAQLAALCTHHALDESSICKFYQLDNLSIFKSKRIEHVRCEDNVLLERT